MQNRNFAKAKAPLQKLIELYPEQLGHDCPYELLSTVHRELKESEDERRILEQYALRTDSAVPFLLRLIELQTTAGRLAGGECNRRGGCWRSTRCCLNLNEFAPRRPSIWNSVPRLSQALQALLAMDPDDPAELHLSAGDVVACSRRSGSKIACVGGIGSRTAIS